MTNVWDMVDGTWYIWFVFQISLLNMLSNLLVMLLRTGKSAFPVKADWQRSGQRCPCDPGAQNTTSVKELC